MEASEPIHNSNEMYVFQRMRNHRYIRNGWLPLLLGASIVSSGELSWEMLAKEGKKAGKRLKR